ncbi:MAG: hypothetical protein H6510_08100 [Acidobacteria bacterium]|nr:hypothetical protein [Acidobacteriota bacterium]MCB9397761.1 hypothetical protein [Acidobacteriota bacterium]
MNQFAKWIRRISFIWAIVAFGLFLLYALGFLTKNTFLWLFAGGFITFALSTTIMSTLRHRPDNSKDDPS